jgi:hypothetical protein
MRNDAWNTMLPERAFRTLGGKLLTLEGGGKGADAPDYTPLAASSVEAAKVGAELGREQMAEARRQYDQNYAAAQPVIASQIRTQEQTAAQGQDYFDYMKANQRPVETALNAQSMRPDTGAASAAEMGLMTGGDAAIQADARYGADISAKAGQAGVDQLSGYSRALNIAARQGMRYGFDPAKLAAQAASQAGQQSSAIAAATNQARQGATDQARGLIGQGRNLRLQDENLGWGRRMDVAGLYRGLTGASAGAYQTGINAGNSAMANQMAPGQGLMTGMAQGAGMQQTGMGQQIQGQTGVLNAQTSYANNAASQSGGGLGAIIGVGGQLGAAAITASDRRLKENIELVGKERGFNIYTFNYVSDPSRRFRGVMADEVELVVPEAVVYGDDGYATVNYTMLGLEMTEV